jgi:hypothetical protein
MAEALPISGHIDPKAFPLLLVDLHRQSATGSLKVDGPTHQKALYFRNGRVLFGSSNDPRDQLGAILVESGRLTAEQLEDVNRKVGPGNPLAKVLADSGIVSQRELSEAARAKVERIVSDVFSYTSGTFDFEDGVLPKGAVDLKLPTDRLFLAAVRRIADRAFVLRHLDTIDVVLKPKPELASTMPEIEAETGSLPDKLDGSRSLKAAAAAAGMDEFEASKVACALLFLGLVERSSMAGEDAESPFFTAPAAQSTEIGFGGGPATLPFSPPTGQESTLVVGSAEMASEPGATPAPSETIAETFNPAPPKPSGPKPLSEVLTPPPPRVIAPPPRVPAPSRPSKADLAALDSLLSASPVEGPLTPLSKGAEPEWHPQFLPEPRRGARPRSAQRSSRWALGAGVVAVLLLAAGGTYLWLSGFFGEAPAEVPRVATSLPSAAPSATPSAAAAVPAATSPVPSAPATATASPAVSATAAVAAGARPTSGPTATSPSAAGSARPSTAPSLAPPRPAAAATPSPATARPTPTPTAARPAATPTPAARVPATPAPRTSAAAPVTAPRPAGAVSLADSRALLRSGRNAEAASGFAAALKPAKGTYTIQLLVACVDETVQKAVAAVPAEEFFILPTHYSGKDCYRMCWGLYDSEAKASGALKTLPAYFREGGAKPKVITAASVLP